MTSEEQSKRIVTLEQLVKDYRALVRSRHIFPEPIKEPQTWYGTTYLSAETRYQQLFGIDEHEQRVLSERERLDLLFQDGKP